MKKYKTFYSYFGYLIEENAFGIWYEMQPTKEAKVVPLDIICLNKSLYFFETKQLWL